MSVQLTFKLSNEGNVESKEVIYNDHQPNQNRVIEFGDIDIHVCFICNESPFGLANAPSAYIKQYFPLSVKSVKVKLYMYVCGECLRINVP